MSEANVIKLKNVRLSFPRLWTPKAFQAGQNPRWEASFLLDPSDKAHAATIALVKSTAKAALTAKFGAKVPAGIKRCYAMSNEPGYEKNYDGYDGMFYITSNNSKARPTVVDRDRVTRLEEADGKPYAGCIVNATISLWVQDNQFGKRVNANLRAVQFVQDAPAFGVKPVDAEEEFDALEEEEATADEFDDVTFS